MDILPGMKFNTTKSGECVVLEKHPGNKLLIKFQDDTGFTKIVSKSDLVRGKVKNPYQKLHYGLGYFGEGPFKSRNDGCRTKEYDTWTCMLQRCYGENRPSHYENCNVAAPWHNFQVFAMWCNKQIGFNEKSWELDKDLLGGVDKHYSPDHCVFLPKELNTFFISKNADQTKGFYKHKKSGKYLVRCGTDYIGLFETEQLAHESYINAKKHKASKLLEKYKDNLDIRVVNKLIKYVENSNEFLEDYCNGLSPMESFLDYEGEE